VEGRRGWAVRCSARRRVRAHRSSGGSSEGSGRCFSQTCGFSPAETPALPGAGAARGCEVEVEAVLGPLGVSGPHEEEAGRAGREFDQDLVAGFNSRFRPVG
jgi:hypothetical protein